MTQHGRLPRWSHSSLDFPHYTFQRFLRLRLGTIRAKSHTADEEMQAGKTRITRGSPSNDSFYKKVSTLNRLNSEGLLQVVRAASMKMMAVVLGGYCSTSLDNRS